MPSSTSAGIRGRSAAASSRRGASPRAASAWTVAGRSSGPRLWNGGELLGIDRRRPARRYAIGPVDPAQHRLRGRPVRRTCPASRSAAGALNSRLAQSAPNTPSRFGTLARPAGRARGPRRTRYSVGVRSLVSGAHASGSRISSSDWPPGGRRGCARQHGLDARDRGRRRVVGDEVADQLGREVPVRPRGGRASQARAVRRRPAQPIREQVWPITVFGAGLMRVGAEDELPGGSSSAARIRPAGQNDLGDTR